MRLVRKIRAKLLTMYRALLSGLLLLLIFVCPTALFRNVPSLGAQQLSQRLILKDGSYQSVVKYEIQGDRVHYLSAERYEWEDLPVSLVDWDATKKYESELSSGKLAPKLEETPEEKEERAKEEANSVEVAPGLRLPGTGGVFLFEQFQGSPELAEILQNGGDVKQKVADPSRNGGIINPWAIAKATLELKGPHAAIQAHSSSPVIYVDINEGEVNDVALQDRFRIVKLTSKNDLRVVGSEKVSITGRLSDQTNYVATNIEKLGTGEWIKVTPAKPLAAGEYALAEILGPKQVSQYVWDFGVNPGAPANPNAWRPVAAKPSAPN